MIIDSNGIMIDEITEQYSENMQYIDDYQLQQIYENEEIYDYDLSKENTQNTDI